MARLKPKAGVWYYRAKVLASAIKLRSVQAKQVARDWAPKVNTFTSIVVSLLLVEPIPSGAANSDCVGGLRTALVAGGFYGPLDCNPAKSSLRLVGRTTGRVKFSIYDYRYAYAPESGNVEHGGQRILIFTGGRYVGEYSMSPPPYTDLAVSGAILILTKEGAETVKADFSTKPPDSIFFDGETEGFGPSTP